MKLHEAVCRINEFSDEGILFVEPIGGEFCSDSRTVVLELSDEELRLPVASVAAAKAPGTEYFLEVTIVKDFVTDWLAANPGTPLISPQAVQRLISYAVNDA